MPWRWRHDGTWVRDLPRIRAIMPFLMRGRNESAVYFEQKIDVTATDAFLQRYREATGLRVTYLHLALWAITQTLHERPRLNRFVAGARIFQRDGIYISFSGKKAKRDDQPLVTVKRRFDPEWPFEHLVRVVEADIGTARSDAESPTDKELKFFLKLPVWLLGLLVRLATWLDRLGLLPRFMTQDDPLFASVFVANLGSIGMDAAYHHLYEYGNIPIFVVMGRVREEVVVRDGQPVVRPIMTVRYTFDERIEDGFYAERALRLFQERMEHPERFLTIPDTRRPEERSV